MGDGRGGTVPKHLALNAPAIVRKHLFCMTASLFEMPFDFFYVLWRVPYGRTIRHGRTDYGGVYLAGFWKSGAPCGDRNFCQCLRLFYQFFLDLSDVRTPFQFCVDSKSQDSNVRFWFYVAVFYSNDSRHVEFLRIS